MNVLAKGFLARVLQLERPVEWRVWRGIFRVVGFVFFPHRFDTRNMAKNNHNMCIGLALEA